MCQDYFEYFWYKYILKHFSIYLYQKHPSSQSYGFSSSLWMWELDYKDSWVLRIDAFELWCWKRLLRVPWTAKEIQPVNPKGNHSWIFIGGTDAEAETPIFQPPDMQNWLIWKDPDVGKDWRQEEKGETGWDGWMASLTQQTWVWVGSGSWWWTGKPGVLQSMGSQGVGHDWVTELNWIKYWDNNCILR